MEKVYMVLASIGISLVVISLCLVCFITYNMISNKKKAELDYDYDVAPFNNNYSITDAKNTEMDIGKAVNAVVESGYDIFVYHKL